MEGIITSKLTSKLSYNKGQLQDNKGVIDMIDFIEDIKF